MEREGLGFKDASGAFVVGLTLLAGLILLAACANLGSLFAARAADRAVPVRQVLQIGPYQIVKSGSLASVGQRFTMRDLLLAAC